MDASLTVSTVADDGLSIATQQHETEQQFQQDFLVSFVVPSLVEVKIPLPTFAMSDEIKRANEEIQRLKEELASVTMQRNSFASKLDEYGQKEAKWLSEQNQWMKRETELRNVIESLRAGAPSSPFRPFPRPPKSSSPQSVDATTGVGSPSKHSTLSGSTNAVSSGAGTAEAQQMMVEGYAKQLNFGKDLLKDLVDNTAVKYVVKGIDSVTNFDPSLPRENESGQGSSNSSPTAQESQESKKRTVADLVKQFGGSTQK